MSIGLTAQRVVGSQSSHYNHFFYPAEFDVKFKGSDALERRGAFYTISDADHPITKLMQLPKKVPRGTSVLIGLNIYQVLAGQV